MKSGLRDARAGRNLNAHPAYHHLVQFYESDDYLLDLLTQFVTRTLSNQDACVIVARAEHAEGLQRRLAESGVDMDAASRRGQFAMFDVSATLPRIMQENEPDPERFEATFGPVIKRAAERWGAVRVFGELVAVFAEERNQDATIKVEDLWNDLLTRYDFTLCCAYPMRAFNQPHSEEFMDTICEQHSAVFPAESYPYWSSPSERHQAIALMQQKAARLAVEVENRKHIEEQLRVALNAERAARQEAEAALRLRDEFVSIAAHELKTPLTSLIGRAQFMLRSQRDGRSVESADAISALESVVGQANKLSRLINQLLDVTRLKGGKLTIERRPADIVTLIRESLDSVRPDIEAFDIALKMPEALVVEIDPIRMEQVIVNLLNNAVKYSPEGSRIEIEVDQAGAKSIRLTVRDYGPGIPPDERNHIFERFYQAERIGPRHGLGLGLYISREIVSLHGGSIHAEFPEDAGTRVIVHLPISSPPDETTLIQ